MKPPRSLRLPLSLLLLAAALAPAAARAACMDENMNAVACPAGVPDGTMKTESGWPAPRRPAARALQTTTEPTAAPVQTGGTDPRRTGGDVFAGGAPTGDLPSPTGPCQQNPSHACYTPD